VPDIHIERNHALGIERAREIALQWVAEAERDYGMSCRYEKAEVGAAGDTAWFKRPGVDGTVQVTASLFTIDIKLGFLLDVFSDRIAEKVTRNLDEMIASQAPGGAVA
jgi:putative polyhydroxyalkanoate system protein